MLQLLVVIVALCTIANPPEWRARFDVVYALAPDEALKHIEPPFIEERLEFYAHVVPEQAQLIPAGPNCMTVIWDDAPSMGGCMFSEPGAGRKFEDTLLHLTRLPAHKVEISDDLKDHELFGDWVIRKDAEPAKIIEALATIVGREIGQRIAVTTQEIEAESIVVSGDAREQPPGSWPRLEIPTDQIQLRHALQGSGAQSGLFEQLGSATGYPVIDETQKRHPSGRFLEWRSSGAAFNPVELERIDPEHMKILLTSLAEQTGLKFEIHPRKFRRWKVSLEK